MLHSTPLNPIQNPIGMQSFVYGIAKGTVEVAIENYATGNAKITHVATIPNQGYGVHRYFDLPA
jgi:hypothetical protein